MTGERLAYVALGALVEPGSRELGRLVRAAGPEVALERVCGGGASDTLTGTVSARLAASGVVPAGDPLRGDSARIADRIAEPLLERAEELKARIATPADADWPRRVDDLTRISRERGDRLDRDTDPPLCLWLRGPVPLDRALERSVAVVGARAATAYGEHVTAELAHGLAERGWSVVSGGAYGIDAMAHRAALAGGGVTVAVLACGVDRPYPEGNANLLDRIGEEGVLMTEWPPGAAPHRLRFLTRNRLIAAATLGTVMVEAAARSGARQTLGRARALGRRALVVPGPVTSALSVGCHAELRREGNRLVSTVDEIVEEVGRIGDLAPEATGPRRPYDDLDPLAAQLLDAVPPRRARTAEEIAAEAGMSGRDARRVLPLLVQLGRVDVVAGGYRLSRTAPRR